MPDRRDCRYSRLATREQDITRIFKLTDDIGKFNYFAVSAPLPTYPILLLIAVVFVAVGLGICLKLNANEAES